MKKFLLALPASATLLLLAGCADSSNPPSSPGSSPVSTSASNHSDSPPVTLSGYMDTSTTSQIK